MVDQELHGPDPPAAGEVAARLAAALAAHAPGLGAASEEDAGGGAGGGGALPHLRFNHLVGYGSTYYSYLYAQALSARLWRGALGGDPTGRAAGELLRRRLMEPGGAREARALVEGLFQPDGGGGGAGLRAVAGGWCPDAGDLLLHHGLEA